MIKRRFFNIFIIVIFIASTAAVIFIDTSALNTTTVFADTVENKIYNEGLITCYADYFVSESDGEALFVYEEGKRVLPNVKIATVYSDALDSNTRDRLQAINSKIVFSESKQRYNKDIINDNSLLGKEITKTVQQVIVETNSENYGNVYDLKNDIIAYNEKIMENNGTPVVSNTVEDAKKQAQELEAGISGSKKTFYSKTGGVFSVKTSNFDTILTPDLASALTPSEYDKLKDTRLSPINGVKANAPFAKVINNYEWYLVASYNAKDIEGIEDVKNLELRIINHSDIKVDATVESISAQENGRVVMVLKSTKYIEGIYTAHEVEFELIKKTNKGLRIPLSAVFEKDGQTGVFAVKDSVYKFMEVEILHRDKSFAIISDKATDIDSGRSHVVIYDLVVTNPGRVKEGAIVN